MSALDDIAAERARQIQVEGYGASHDDQHQGGELARAAAAYAIPVNERSPGEDRPPFIWPFEEAAWKPAPLDAVDEEGLGWPTLQDRRAELVKAAAMLAAEVDRLDRAHVGVPQAYFPHALCWHGITIQCAVAIRASAIAFLERHPHIRVFSGLRIGDHGDHRCGYALDMVPLDFTDKGAIVNAFTDAGFMQKRGEVAYVEPLAATWIPGNHHLHVSWRRCP